MTETKTKKTCTPCGGTGHVPDHAATMLGIASMHVLIPRTKTCTRCHGSGKVKA